MLPKIHKNLSNPSGRPIISGNGSILGPISKFTEHHVKSFVPNIPSYIHDTTQVLNKIDEIKNMDLPCFLFVQSQGTDMGVTYAPSYANLFLGVGVEKFIWSSSNPYLEKIKWFGHYIDDLIFFMQCEEHVVLEFHKYLNNTNKSLKLSLEYSKKEINFLVMKITDDEDTTIHWKPLIEIQY